MNYRKNHFFTLITTLLLLCPFLLPGQTVLFQEDWDAEGPGGWSLTEFPVYGNSRTFRWQLSYLDNGADPIAPINSTTAANGWLRYDSDFNCADPFGANAWMISPPLNAENAQQVILNFETYYRSYNDRPQIRVGTELTIINDKITDQSLEDWATYEVFPGIQADEYGGGDSTLNPQPISIDISGAAAGEPVFYFAFQYLSDASTINGGYDPLSLGCGYSWQIDDIEVIADPSFNEISCGEGVVVQGGNKNNIGSYSCGEGYPGNDNVFRFEIADPATVVVELDNELDNATNLDLFLLQDNGNAPGPCIASSESGTSEEELVLNLTEGVYWISVDQFDANSGPAMLNLRINCFPNESPLQIACGETLVGTNKGAASTASASQINECFDGTAPFGYTGGDRRYQFTVNEESTVLFQFPTRGPGNVDGFIFSNNGEQLGICQDSNSEPGSGQLVANLLTGTYWILIDSPNPGEEGAFDLNLNCFPVDNRTTLTCGDIFQSTTSGAEDNYGDPNYVGCLNGTVPPYDGGDRIYQFTLPAQPAQQTVSLNLVDLIDRQLELFLLDSEEGQVGTCRTVGLATGAPGELRIMETLDAGATYWVIIDGQSNLNEGPFELSFSCFPAQTDELGTITSGVPVEGNSIGSIDDFPGPENAYSGGDQAYSFEIRDNPQQILLSLSSRGTGALDLFLYPDAGGSPDISNDPIAQSTQDSLANEVLFLILDVGKYWVIVDSREAPGGPGIKSDPSTKSFPPLTEGGPYTLSLNAADLQTLCDLDETLVIRSGNAVSSLTGTPLLEKDGSAEAGIIPSDVIAKIDCVEGVFPSPAGQQPKISGNIYTYYHEVAGSFTVEMLEGTAPDVKVFVFKCAEDNRSSACLGVLENGSRTFNDQAGYYTILVGSETPNRPYTIQLTSENQCIPETQTPISDLSELTVNLQGTEDDFNRDNYSACFSGIASLYDGPDRVYTFEVRNSLNERGEENLSTLELSEIDASAAVGLVLFKDLCEGNCRAFAEYDPNSLQVNEPGYPSFRTGGLESGIYYLVVDQAAAGPPMANFNLKFTTLVQNQSTAPLVTFFHTLSFQNILPPTNVDKVFITFDRANPDYAEANFEAGEQEITLENDGTLADTRIPFTGPYKGGPKLGFDENEKFLFVGRRGTTELPLQAVFNNQKSPAINRFRKNGDSEITQLKTAMLEQAPTLQLDPKNVNIPPTKNEKYLILVSTNQDWVILDTSLPDNWVVPEKTSGKQGENISLSIAANDSSMPRQTIFKVQVIDPVTNFRKTETVRITQNGISNTCLNNQIQFQNVVVDDTCPGNAGGSISFTVSGISGAPEFSWSNDLEDRAVVSGPVGNAYTVNVPDLLPGTYSVIVSDANQCLARTKIDVPHFSSPEPEITGELGFCADSSTDLSAGEFSTYQWSNGANTPTITVTDAGPYSVTVTDTFGCSGSSDEVTVTVNPVPEPQITGALSFCAGGSTALSVAGFNAYVWSTGATTPSITVNQAGTYGVTVTGANGCTASDEVMVSVNPLPDPQITGKLSFCTGGSTALSVGTFNTYLWSNGAATPSITVTQAGNYGVTVTNAGGCVGTDQVTVLVNPLPDPEITGTLSFCDGGSTALTVGAFNTYLWSNGATTPSITVNQAGNYGITVTNAGGCVGTDQVTVSVNPLPEPQITGALSFCAGSNTELSVGAFNTYLWSNGSTTSSITVNQAGNYGVTVTDINGCSGTDQVTVSVSPLLEPEITGALAFCAGSSTELSAGVFNTYLWSTGATTPSITVNQAGNYSVTVTDAGGCSGSDQVTVSVNPLPDPQITGALSFCAGGSTALNVGAFNTYLWSTGATTPSITVNQAGNYGVTVTDTNGCSGSDQVTVSVNPLPEPEITGALGFCAGGNTALSVGTFNTYLWSNGATTPSITVNQAGNYGVTVTDAGGCSGTDQVTVSVNPLPDPQITGALSFCAGSNTELSVGAFNTYLWSTGATTPSITVNQAGNYGVTVTDTNGCSGSDQVTVSVSPLLEPQITGALSFCAGGSTELNAGTFNTYLWSTGATTPAITVNQAGNYSVTVTDAGGCSGTDQVTVSVNPLPDPQITGALSFCAGGSTALSVGAFNTYLWSTGATTPSITVSQAGNYGVTVTNANGCTGTDQVTVSVNPLPDPQITGALSFCAGGSTALSVGAFNTYLWSTGATTPSITVNQAGSYGVTVTDANGCTGSDQVTVTVNPLPEPEITGALSFCAGGSTALSVGAFNTYLWSTGATTPSITVNQAGNYGVTVTDTNGCSGSDQVTVSVSPLLEPQITGTLSFCAGGSTELNAGTFNTYLWSTGATTPSITVSQAGNYGVTVTDAGGCSGSDQVTVSVNPLPDPQITGALSFCAGGNTALSVGAFNTYLWSNGATTPSITVSQAGTYGVTVTDANGCSGTDQVTVTVNPLPEPEITGALSFCAGGSTALSVGAFNTYLWSTGATTPSITVNQAGNYGVTVTDAGGCSGSDQVTVSVNPLPEPEITGALGFCAGGSTVLSVGAFNTYLWSNGATTPSITVNQANTYSVTVTDANGCSGSDQVTVSVRPLLEPPITGTLSFCAGGSTILSTGTSFNTYLWSTGATTPSITVTQAGPYSVTVTDANGCSGSNQVTVSVSSLPDPQITGALSFCDGGNTELSVGAFNTYLWSTGATTPSITVDQAGTYGVTVTDANGCSGNDQVTVTVNPLPEPEITGALSFCTGGSTALSVGAFNTYLWSTGAATPSITVDQAGTYGVTVTDANGCSGGDQVTVTVNPLPEPEIIGALSFCAGGSTELSVGTFATYLWSNGATTASITVEQTGTYSVTVTDDNGCQGSDEVNVSRNPLPKPQIAGSLSICSGGNTTLNAGSFAQYLWSNDAVTPSITVDAAGEYAVTVTDLNGCTATASVTVVESEALQPQITGPLSFCTGGSTILDAGNFAQYLWSNEATTPTITVSTAGDYAVTVTDQNGCSGTASVTVTENPLPQLVIAGDLSFCAGQSSTLSVGEFADYLWSTGGLNASITVTGGGIYSVTVTDENGCQGSAEVTVTPNALPEPQITGTLSFCAGSSTELSTGTFAAYLWSNGATTASITVDAAGTYSVTVTDDNGCQGSAQVNVSSNPVPAPQIAGSLSICAGSNTTLDAGSFAQYLWSNGAVTASITVDAAGEYAVTVTNDNGCTGTAAVTVVESESLQPQITGTLSFCTGTSTILDAGSFTQYLWSTGAVTQSITVNAAGTYSVTVTDQNGCTGTASVSVTENPLPEPAIEGELNICAGASTTLRVGEYAAYLWSIGGLNDSITVTQAGTYSVTVTDENGCEGSAEVTVTLNALPEPQITGELSFCAGNSTELSAGTFAAYLWSNGATTASITVDQAGTYSLTVTDDNGCQGSAQVNVTSNPVPAPQIAGSLSICAGSNTTLEAGSFAQYLWSNGAVTPSITVDAAGEYAVTVTNDNGCTGTTSVTVVESESLQPQITGTLSFCTGTSTILDAGSFAQYLWSTGAVTQSITVDAAGEYAVTVTDQNGCTGTASVSVTENPLPEPAIEGALSICAGESTTLRVGEYAAYLWSIGGLNDSITVTQAGTYSVTVTDENGCEGSAEVTVTLNALPEPQITGALSFCAGDSTELITGIFAAYLWSNGETTASITVKQAGTYSLTVTDDNGCQGSAQVNVSSNPVPEPQIAGSLSICAGSNTTLEAGSFAQYLWSNGAVTPSITVDAAGDYAVTVTNDNGCTGTASVTVIESESLQPQITGTLRFCTGTSTILDAGSFAEYLWSTGAVTQSITVDAAGEYAVTVTDQNGCTGTASVSVTENPLPELVIEGELSICAGESTTLRVGEFTEYLWSIGALTNSITVTQAGTYSVTVTDDNGCQGSAEVTVTLNALPEPEIAGALSFCAGDSTELTVGTFAAYLWSNGATTASITVKQAGTYSVTVTDDNGCQGSAQVNVTSNPLPEPQIAGSLSICAEGNTTLDAGSFAQYLWSNGAMTQSITVDTAGDYSVTVTNDNGCTGTASVAVIESESLQPQITGPLSFCTGSSTILDAGSFAEYLWSTGAVTQSITVDAAGDYAVTVTDQNGCTGTASVSVVENPLPQPVIEGELNICAGENITIRVGEYAAYLWSIGGLNDSITVNQAGTYSVTVTDENGCQGSDEVTVTLNELPEPQISGELSFCAGDSTELSAGTFAAYLWSNGETTASITVKETGTYSVTVSDNNGCQGSDQINVTANPIPEPQITGSLSICTGSNTVLDAGDFAHYLWSTGDTTQFITVDAAGEYAVTVTNDNACTGEASVSVTQSESLQPQITGTLSLCTGSNTVLDAGDFAQYLWSTGETTQMISVDTVGDYSVTVTDANGCSGETSATVTENPLPQPEITGDLSFCTGAGSQLSVGAFEAYLWSNGATTQSTTVSAAGDYSVTVTDANGCAGADTVQVTVIGSIALAINSVTGVTCAGGTDGAITYEASGGEGPLTVVWSDADGPIDSLVNLAAGSYTVEISDGSSCSYLDTVRISEPMKLELFLSVTDETADDVDDGSISAQVSGGTPPYDLMWSNGSTATVQNDLAPGKYNVTLTDAAGCTVRDSVFLNPFSCSPLVELTPVPVSCVGGSDGSASLEILGGDTPLDIKWSNGSTTPEVTGLSAGDYSVVVVDEEFCSQVISFKISEPNTPPLEVIVDSLSTESGDTYIQVSITGGKPPYLFFWTKDGETFSDLEDLEDLGPGIYQLIVRDDGGCQIASDEFDFRGVTSSREPNELDLGLTLFPNPVGEHLYIRKEIPFNQPIQVHLVDMLGRRVYQGVFPADARQFSIDVDKFAAGFYWVRFRMDYEESSQKIIIN